MIKIFHNPRCGKSREGLQILQHSKKEFEVVKYLENVPTAEELKFIIDKLNCKPIDLVRKKEKIWLENFNGKILTDDEIIGVMIANPILIERPIVINGDKVAIGRPPQNISKIL